MISLFFVSKNAHGQLVSGIIIFVTKHVDQFNGDKEKGIILASDISFCSCLTHDLNSIANMYEYVRIF